jgi:hypothetical protein
MIATLRYDFSVGALPPVCHPHQHGQNRPSCAKRTGIGKRAVWRSATVRSAGKPSACCEEYRQILEPSSVLLAPLGRKTDVCNFGQLESRRLTERTCLSTKYRGEVWASLWQPSAGVLVRRRPSHRPLGRTSRALGRSLLLALESSHLEISTLGNSAKAADLGERVRGTIVNAPEPAFPCSGFAMKVHDGNDMYDVASQIWSMTPVVELVGSAAAGSRGERGAGFGILKSSLDSVASGLTKSRNSDGSSRSRFPQGGGIESP